MQNVCFDAADVALLGAACVISVMHAAFVIQKVSAASVGVVSLACLTLVWRRPPV